MRHIYSFLCVLLISTSLTAQAPKTLNLQGLLTDNAGVAVAPGDYDFVLKIFTVASGGSPIWTETQNNITVDGEGIYSLVIGSVTPLALNFDNQYWLEITVETETFTERLELTGAAYVLDPDLQDLADGSIPSSKVTGLNNSHTHNNLSNYAPAHSHPYASSGHHHSSGGIGSSSYNQPGMHLTLNHNNGVGMAIRNHSTGNYWRMGHDGGGHLEWTNSDGPGSPYTNGIVFYTDGVIRVNGSTLGSDRRLKEDIRDLSYGLNDILQLRAKTYRLIGSDKQDFSIGLIAQEVQEVIGELITTDQKGFLELNYVGLIPVLIKAIQEQQLMIEELKAQNQEMAKEVSQIMDLKARVEALEEILNTSGRK